MIKFIYDSILSKIGEESIIMSLQKKNVIQKTINFLLNILIIIFGIVLLISLYTGIQIKIFGYRYADFFGYSTFEVQTGSMADEINAGDWIIVKLTPKIQLNDVVTYELNGEYITHRVIAVYNDTYTTMGDNNSAKDAQPVKKSQIVGKVVSVLHSFGIVRKIIFNPGVLISLIITLFFLNLAIKKNKSDTKEQRPSLIDVEGGINTLFEKKNNSEMEINKTNEQNDDVYKEDELEKTSLYRVIPVDMSELDKSLLSKYKHENKFITIIKTIGSFIKRVISLFKRTASVISISEIEVAPEPEGQTKPTNEVISSDLVSPDIEEVGQDEMVPVDMSEMNDTLLEIAQNEIKEAEEEKKKKEELLIQEIKPEEKPKEVEEKDDALTKINLEMLKKIKNKSKNIINTAILIKKEELNELMTVLIENHKMHVNEDTIKEAFITAYIDAKYYNYYGAKKSDGRGKKLISKIKEAIKEVALASELINTYHRKNVKDDDTIEMYSNILILIANLEYVKDSITDTKAKKQFYKREIMKYSKNLNNKQVDYIIEQIMNIQKSYAGVLECFYKNLETNMFTLNFNKLSNKKDMYGLELHHNISFSKVYSDYIIEKTYTEGIVAEDKITVLLTLLLVQVVKDMISSNFDRKYLLYIPNSLYAKEKKVTRLLKMIDDKYAKDNVIILLSYDDLLHHKQVIKRIRKSGYKFALVFYNETVINEKERGNIYIADYIFMEKGYANATNIASVIPDDLLNNIIYENVIEKVGDFGSE